MYLIRFNTPSSSFLLPLSIVNCQYRKYIGFHISPARCVLFVATAAYGSTTAVPRCTVTPVASGMAATKTSSAAVLR